jgi:serine phosphatase RsbU (regulator of sigma subunit)
VSCCSLTVCSKSKTQPTLFTEEQLHRTVTRYAALPAQEFFHRVINDVRQFSERKSFDDDVCVVGMEVQRTG